MKKISLVLGIIVMNILITSCEKEELEVESPTPESSEIDEIVDTTSYAFMDVEGNDISWVFEDGYRLRSEATGFLYFHPNSDSIFFNTWNSTINENISGKYRYLGSGLVEVKYSFDVTVVGSYYQDQCDTMEIKHRSYGDPDMVDYVYIDWVDFSEGSYPKYEGYTYIRQD